MNKKGGIGGFGNFVEVNYFHSKQESNHDDKDPEKYFTSTVDAFKDGVNIILDSLQERMNLFAGDIIEPLELYIQHREQTCKKQLDQAKQAFNEVNEKELRHQEYKRLYHALCEESEMMEIEIEKALLSQIQKEISVEKVQETMNHSLNIKYKVQVALKNYKESISELNIAYQEITHDYKPMLQ